MNVFEENEQVNLGLDNLKPFMNPNEVLFSNAPNEGVEDSEFGYYRSAAEIAQFLLGTNR